ncbi:TraB/GumN family protein [Bacillus gobiensis]|uniref:TraB/GumN family protein n=1 Tax=Bacillus gobiensis TaxID=1441095 RepID=UPI003D1E641D
MKKISILLPFLLLVGMLVSCNTEEDGEEMIEKPVEEEVRGGNGGFLWKVEHGDTVVYLQGTIHVGKEKFYPLNPQTEEAYEKSDIVLPEVDLNNTDLS